MKITSSSASTTLYYRTNLLPILSHTKKSKFRLHSKFHWCLEFYKRWACKGGDTPSILLPHPPLLSWWGSRLHTTNTEPSQHLVSTATLRPAVAAGISGCSTWTWSGCLHPPWQHPGPQHLPLQLGLQQLPGTMLSNNARQQQGMIITYLWAFYSKKIASPEVDQGTCRSSSIRVKGIPWSCMMPLFKDDLHLYRTVSFVRFSARLIPNACYASTNSEQK